MPLDLALRRSAADGRDRPCADGNPALLLFDEISLGLAPIVIKSIYETLAEHHRGGTSAIIVEQDIVRAMAVSTRVYLPAGGPGLTGRPLGGADRAKRSPTPISGSEAMQWVDAIVQGILLGGLYALFAAGLSLIFGVMRLVNIAHGDLIVLAAYLGLTVTLTLGIHPLSPSLIVVPGHGRIGYVLQRGMLNQTLGDDILPPLLVTFGLSVIMQNGLLELFTADSRKSCNAGPHRDRQRSASPASSLGVLPMVMFAVGRRRDRRAAIHVLPHRARPRLPRHLRQSRLAQLDGARQPPRLRPRHGAVAGGRRDRRASSSASAPASIRRAARPAHLRLRGGDHRRPRQSLGHAGRRRHPRRRPERSARRSIPAGSFSPATSPSSLVLALRPRGLFPRIAG